MIEEEDENEYDDPFVTALGFNFYHYLAYHFILDLVAYSMKFHSK